MAVPETEGGWVRYAASVNVRQLERAVACGEKGDEAPAPGVVPTAAPKRVRLVFEVDASRALLIRKAMAVVRARLGESGAELPEAGRPEVSDSDVLGAWAEREVANQSEGERPIAVERFQTLVHVCDHCEYTTLAGVPGEPHTEVSDAVAARARCDSVVVDLRPGPGKGAVTHKIPERVRRQVLDRDRYCCAAPGCRHNVWLQLHHVVERNRGGDHEVFNLLTLCSRHHTMIHEGILLVERAPAGSFAFDWRVPPGKALRQPTASPSSSPSVPPATTTARASANA